MKERTIDQRIEEYLISSDDSQFPVIRKDGKICIYQTFVGPNEDGYDFDFKNIMEIAILADKLRVNESLSNQELVNSIRYSNEIKQMRDALLEYSLNEIPEYPLIDADDLF